MIHPGRHWMLKRQSWSFSLELGSATAALISLVLLKPAWALAWGLVATAAALVTRRWAGRDPIPFPYALHPMLLGPRPFLSPGRLEALLALRGGERLLEVGPGTGKYALPIAASLGSDGKLAVLDIQQEMLDHLMRRAARAGISNIAPAPGDAARLPYPDQSFDGAYLITVLGEIPDKESAIRELHRVLKPGACLVMGEMFGDPDFIPLSEMRRRLAATGFVFESKIGPSGAYLARFRKAAR